jgi:signal transduction histidine kinase/FixJ family two-component response regulator
MAEDIMVKLLNPSEVFTTNPSHRQADVVRVLHLDDEEDHLTLTKMFLEREDPSIQVTSASSPIEALNLIQSQDFDCIISDYRMPKINGIEFAKIVKETTSTPFIIYTGHGSEEIAEAAFSAGVDDYIRKEFDPSHYKVLLKRIKSVVEKRKAESSFASSLETLLGILETIPSGLLIYQYEPPDRLVLRYSNPEARRLIGFDIEEWMGKEFAEIWQYDKQVGLKERYLKILETGTPVRIDNLYWTDEKVEGYFNIRTFKIPGNKIAVAFENISERVVFEESLKENAKRLEYLMKDKAEEILLAEKLFNTERITIRVVSDLTGLLRDIKNIAYLMRRTSDNKDKMLEILEITVDQAVDILEEFQSTVADVPLRLEETDLMEFIEGITHEISIPDSIVLKIDYDKNLKTVQIDKNKIKMVLGNLIKNATESMQDNGQLIITTKKKDDHFQVGISDTGTGITEKEMKSIFTPLYKTKLSKRGFSLIYCKRVVEAHGGSMTVESRVGKGTNFLIHLPLNIGDEKNKIDLHPNF